MGTGPIFGTLNVINSTSQNGGHGGIAWKFPEIHNSHYTAQLPWLHPNKVTGKS